VGARLGLALRVRTHVCVFCLPRAAACPCRARGTGIPGPRHDAAAKGDDSCRLDEQRDGLRHKSGMKAERGKGDPRAGYEGIIGIIGSPREMGAAATLTGGARGQGA
jgi:hypothetical protein